MESFLSWLPVLVSAIGAFLGGYALVHPAGGAALAAFGPSALGAPGPGVRALGGAMLLGHATALAALVQSPAIGACIAAGLGTAWLGAACGRSLAAVLEGRREAGDIVRAGLELAAGLALWAPLWHYLHLLRGGAGAVVI
jgi:hypothetical protein